MRFARHFVEKPWGRSALPSPFDEAVRLAGLDGRSIGEIWFQPDDGRELPLLVKYIFTSEKLSVQVHPDDAKARERGHKAGKNECWLILDAEPGAVIGLGTVEPVEPDRLREAAQDGSIERLMDWKPVSRGEFYMVPAGTVHAIGAGITLVEIQQNSDLTYRLYDYGRPRELHLAHGVAAADARPHPDDQRQTIDPDGATEQLLGRFPQFDVLYSRDVAVTRQNHPDRAMWIVPLSGTVCARGQDVGPGGCLYLEPGDQVDATPGASALIGIGAP